MKPKRSRLALLSSEAVNFRVSSDAVRVGRLSDPIVGGAGREAAKNGAVAVNEGGV